MLVLWGWRCLVRSSSERMAWPKKRRMGAIARLGVLLGFVREKWATGTTSAKLQPFFLFPRTIFLMFLDIFM